MKKIMNKVVCVLIMIIVFMPFIAQGQRPEGFTVDGIRYIFYNNSSTHVYVSRVGDSNSISVTIPRSVVCEYSDDDDRDENDVPIVKRITCTVTSIGTQAFFDCSSLTSVTIPDSVTSIGDGVFISCDSLKEVHISDLAKWCNIEFSNTYANPLIYADNLYLNGNKVTQLVIPDGVTSIGDYVFHECSSLTSVTIPDSVTSIGAQAFDGCSSLTSVTIGKSVTSIGDFAFRGCSSLTSVTIPDSVTSIGKQAFYGCRSLNDVYLSDIGAWCGIDFSSTTGSSDYRSPFEYAKNLYLGGKLVTTLEIPAGVTKIPNYVFCNADCIQSVSIPDSVTSIGSKSFWFCDNIISAKAPQSVMGMGLSTIFEYSYQKHQSLCLRANVTAICADEFNGCRALTHIEVEAGNVCYVKGEDGCLYDIERKQLLFCPRDKERINIPRGVTTIGNFAFQYCTNLVSVSMPNTLQKIGTYSFQGCSKLSGVTIPNSVNVLPTSAFDGCDILWTDWYRALALLAINGGGSSGGEDVEPSDPRYVLSTRPTDRSIATVTVDGDAAIDSFVLSDGKVYDTVVRVINVSERMVKISLPQGYTYETIGDDSPLDIPANSKNIITITRTAPDAFLVVRQVLRSIQ